MVRYSSFSSFNSPNFSGPQWLSEHTCQWWRYCVDTARAHGWAPCRCIGYSQLCPQAISRPSIAQDIHRACLSDNLYWVSPPYQSNPTQIYMTLKVKCFFCTCAASTANFRLCLRKHFFIEGGSTTTQLYLNHSILFSQASLVKCPPQMIFSCFVWKSLGSGDVVCVLIIQTMAGTMSGTTSSQNTFQTLFSINALSVTRLLIQRKGWMYTSQRNMEMC